MKYFGTDGIREHAEFFTPEFLHKVVKGLVNYGGENIRVLVGGDTRESTEWILQDLCAAFETLGVEFGSVGVLPTPAINYCFYEMGFDFAIDVTASHNPYTDNGLKIFERGVKSGIKLCEAGCEMIEAAIENENDFEIVATSLREDLHDEAVEIYREHLLEFVDGCELSGLKIGMDCANGATSVINKTVLEKLGAEVTLINCDDDFGQNINNSCGSTHIEALSELVKNSALDFGVAFDGDGDRSLFVDQNGELVDGDQVIVIITNALRFKTAAVTVMSNQGLFDWAKKSDVKLEVTAVGDHNVMLAMQEQNIPIGGEQSGHTILPGQTTGDGLLTAAMIAKIVKESGESLATLAAAMTKFPQIVVNVEATDEMKTALKTSEAAKQLLLDYNEKISAVDGRMLVRPSGTEKLIRVTMWGRDEAEITALANELSAKLVEVL